MQFIDGTAVLVQREYAGVVRQCVVAMERGRRAGILQTRAELELACRARLVLLALHGGVEGGRVDADVGLAADVGGQVEWKAIGVVQLEGQFAVERDAGR